MDNLNFIDWKTHAGDAIWLHLYTYNSKTEILQKTQDTSHIIQPPSHLFCWSVFGQVNYLRTPNLFKISFIWYELNSPPLTVLRSLSRGGKRPPTSPALKMEGAQWPEKPAISGCENGGNFPPKQLDECAWGPGAVISTVVMHHWLILKKIRALCVLGSGSTQVQVKFYLTHLQGSPANGPG